MGYGNLSIGSVGLNSLTGRSDSPPSSDGKKDANFSRSERSRARRKWGRDNGKGSDERGGKDVPPRAALRRGTAPGWTSGARRQRATPGSRTCTADQDKSPRLATAQLKSRVRYGGSEVPLRNMYASVRIADYDCKTR